MSDSRIGLALYPFMIVAGWFLFFLLMRLADVLDRREARQKAPESSSSRP